ncbi:MULTISPECIES: bifunctional 2-polyprenyl-6-hydroxyphenol methylase/3-demethylubiquinol 3-O-methyltransferase UbiG [unclassified Mycolicibacterium]|uniref:class I SAM-dependent methyltransferase n=1 Tax=unclassified Mycolicibacterium TaxID=2636767 RepID=UPI0012DC33C0|nr:MULTISPECIES: class I SAM-dependent methyltransferase [unclassified Mycolicibacterium]MUL84022.1 class I SAM-dependent methyltransferase [Mycolicibacterium sp. CBMA 329]MUL89912.1 class I SAM-dependent methyltransferase [Mycolicibacterium sp. CBMA 331]MUL98067.1 class I SAM-dependent methyltransferase [Mycolicibacterium sp. CBMA 334]MUM25815.1 class I SAM-dependent methyltransferase [Mycolicibacterium sp. CBMA 295]MUM39427.1 class I SAM-dependent methyltransferase [Mycolicibacterium sp. CBM
MDIRRVEHPVIRRAAEGLHNFNGRHPWSHNDHFHRWILANLPARRDAAIDIGCGQGELVAQLAAHFERVHGTDRDSGMRAEAARRCAGLTNVTIDDSQLAQLNGSVDLITMVAVLHHLDVEQALIDVKRLLAPGGRFLAVGLAARASIRDTAWDLASAVTNPLIGLVKHPRPVPGGPVPPPFPVRDPQLSFDALQTIVETVLPGAVMRRRLAFRHTIGWTKPPQA